MFVVKKITQESGVNFVISLPDCHGSRERQHRYVYGNLRISFTEPAFGAGFGRIKKSAPGR